MISHFVNKDARNWDKYVPYAVMAYRATPHCSVNPLGSDDVYRLAHC
jgi:hypothetical protein